MILLLFILFFDALLFICGGWFRPKSGMKNCNLLNRIVPQARQSLRHFTNESAEKLGAKLCNGHGSTIDEPAIARRNQHPPFCHSALNQESFFHDQPQAGWELCRTYSVIEFRSFVGGGPEQGHKPDQPPSSQNALDRTGSPGPSSSRCRTVPLLNRIRRPVTSADFQPCEKGSSLLGAGCWPSS